MKLILNNPYRQLGLLVGATAREQSRQINRLKAYLEADQATEDGFSFPALGQLPRTLQVVENAESKLNLGQDRINAALLWFWNGKPVTDEAAFDALKEGDIDGALNIWENLTTETNEGGEKIWKPIAEKNASAFHNISVLYLAVVQVEFLRAIGAKIKFIESDYFNRLAKDAVDETYNVSKRELELSFLSNIIETLDGPKQIDLFKYLGEYEFAAKADFQKSIIQKPVEKIEHLIETTKNKRKASKANAAEAGQSLYTETAKDLSLIKSILGSSDLKYTSLADKVANEILQCSIEYFNDSQEKKSTSDYATTAMQLAKQADSVAAGKLTKDRIKDSITTLEGMKDNALSQAINLLRAIKEAFDTNKDKIKSEVRSMIIGHNQMINWDKVNQMIDKSLDWNKVVELILKDIPPQNIEKIKNSTDTVNLEEFRNLVDFVLGKLNFTQLIKVKYICYWKTERVADNAQLTWTSIPIWAKWCIGIVICLALIGLIWGKEGIDNALGFGTIIGILFLFGWIQQQIR